MINEYDCFEYCPECDRTVLILPHKLMDSTEWVCAECGAIVDWDMDDYEDDYLDKENE